MGTMNLLCPRCRTELQDRPTREILVHGCASCGGVWLDRDGSARLGTALASKALAIAEALGRAATREPDEVPSIDCPLCAEILIRTQVAEAAVFIDRCPDHGAWYDRNELQKVARALAPVPPRTSGPKPAYIKNEGPAKPVEKKAPAKNPPPPPPPLESKDNSSSGGVSTVVDVVEVAAGVIQIVFDLL